MIADLVLLVSYLFIFTKLLFPLITFHFRRLLRLGGSPLNNQERRKTPKFDERTDEGEDEFAWRSTHNEILRSVMIDNRGGLH